jgi:hypothetical protein
MPRPLRSVMDAIVEGIVAGLREVSRDLLKAFGPVLDRNEEPYSYIFTFADTTTTVANGAVGTATQNFEQASYFVCTSREYYAVPASGTNTDTLIQIILSGSSHRWFTERVFAQASFGTGQRPHFLPKPHIIMPGSTVQAEIENVSGVTLNRGQIVFNGYRVFSKEALGWLMRA